MLRFTDFDFGVTRLAGHFHQDWSQEGRAADLVARALPQRQERAVEALRRDAVLLGTGLSTGDIEALWQASVSGWFRFGIGGDAPSGHGWMQTIVAGCDRWYAERRLDRVPEPDPEPGLRLAGAVGGEIRAMGVLTSRCPPGASGWPPRTGGQGAPGGDGGDAVSAALLRCTTACSPDLAMRFLVRIAGTRGQPISADRYQRLLFIGEQLRYGEFLVSELAYLVE